MNPAIGIAALCIAAGGGGILGCGGNGENSENASPASSKPASSASASERSRAEKRSRARTSGRRGVSVKVMNSRYGRMLFDGNGRALYLFTREKTSRSRCYGDCAVAWPPFFTKGKPRARSGVKSSLLGTTKRRDGKTQVTYRGHPLYYYVTDRKAGQVTCQDVDEFGGTWLVVSPSGRAIR
jgi:predicted lipoprotein with Yx(FWY)xxD motif